mmetsp:Transcript_82204/g.228091  ORF Transcript_82204/g.228091 Transcript_82204/m.228091 type:complete len:489 (+) Transcript_82204:65-1531(+)
MGACTSQGSATRHRAKEPKVKAEGTESPCPGKASSSSSYTKDKTDEEEGWSWRRVFLEHYEVKGADVLGIGNFSVVRRGVDLRTGAAVAVKTLKSSDVVKFRREVLLFDALLVEGSDNQFALLDEPAIALKEPSRFQRSATIEASKQELLLHQGKNCTVLPQPSEMVVRLLDHTPLRGLEPGQPCHCVMELGQFTLHDLVVHCRDAAKMQAAHSLGKEDELLRLLLHMLQALSFLHSRMFVHGDLKPANVMWFQGGSVPTLQGAWKLIDLDGLRTSCELVDMADADFYTATYAAPELAAAVAAEAALRLSRRLDVWALGVTLLELELLRSPLWPKYEELCGDDGDLKAFFLWLGSAEEPLPLPAAPRVASAELLDMLGTCMLVRDAERRSSLANLLEVPLLKRARSVAASAPFPALQPAAPPSSAAAPPAVRTAWQLFQEAHKAELQSQGLKGGQITRELHARWKKLLSEGGEELDELRRQEAALKGE